MGRSCGAFERAMASSLLSASKDYNTYKCKWIVYSNELFNNLFILGGIFRYFYAVRNLIESPKCTTEGLSTSGLQSHSSKQIVAN